MMNRIAFGLFRTLMLALLLISTACTSASPAAPTVAPTSTPVPATATATKPPTKTPRPTATPNLAATKEVEDFQARINGYAEEGYISTTEGTLYHLLDYKREWAQINYLSELTPSGHDDPVKDFVFTGDFQWESAVPNPETSGCGVYYRLQDNGSFYSAYLDTERVVMGGFEPSASRYLTRFGVTSGSGRVKIEKPAKANFTLVLNGHMAYVLVDQEFVGSYTLYTGKLLDPGYLAYFVKSGTNKDFGTRCTIENARLWVPKQ
jgi:hypothetical protein